MPNLPSTAYQTAEDVLNLVRALLNDSEVPGGDVFTDTAAFTFPFLNAGYRRVQKELAKVGVEVSIASAWLIGLPTMPTIDPEGRMIVDDEGTHIVYPNGVGNNDYATPVLPTDLVVPLTLWERQNGTTNYPEPMKQPNGGISTQTQQNFLGEWEWQTDELRFRGALQSEDVKLRYERELPALAAPTDPVPIRDVTNAAAYFTAVAFVASRGGAIAPQYQQSAMQEIFLVQQLSARRRQRKQVRRRPYSGRGGRGYLTI